MIHRAMTQRKIAAEDAHTKWGRMMQRLTIFAIAAVLIGGNVTLPPAAQAETVIDEWVGVKLPPAPALKPVTLAPNETAVLAMDFTTQTCTPQRRPRCAEQVPQVAKL